MIRRLIARAKAFLARQAIRPKMKCERCGERFYAKSFYETEHEETLDGVACGGRGFEVAA
jgi:formylmethanofuran dehydrogenase subunit E